MTKEQTATVAMTTYSGAEGRKHMQSQRGGNLPLPARVEVTVKIADREVSVTLALDGDGIMLSYVPQSERVTRTAAL